MPDHHKDQRNSTYTTALDTAAHLLGSRLEPFLAPTDSEPANGADFKRLATTHTFGDAWPRTDILDVRTRALVSVTIAAQQRRHPGRGRRDLHPN